MLRKANERQRIDRVFSRNANVKHIGHVKLINMEDFCQLDLRLTQNTYKGSYERCGNIIVYDLLMMYFR